MSWPLALTILCIASAASPAQRGASTGRAPDTVIVRNGSVTLRGLVWRPTGRGPSPAILINHGSGRTREELARLGPYEGQADTLGPVFARHGYVVLFLFRRGVGLSASGDTNAFDLMNAESAAHGPTGRNTLQLRLLEGREMGDALAGLAFLRRMPGVDANDIGLVGHSFGGSLTLLMVAQDPRIRAAVIFSGAGYSWDRSPELRQRLLAAAEHVQSPVFLIHAANDYSTGMGTAVDARLRELGKPHRLKIYPPIGRTAEDGHDFPLRGVPQWEPDVFAFLDEYMRPNSPRFMYIYRDSLRSGVDSEYREIENDGARICVDFRCPNPYLALESLSGTHEAWWINEFGSVADTVRVSKAYGTNRPLAAALAGVAKRKASLIGTPIQGFAVYRPDLSRGPSWWVAGARFTVVSITHDPRPADGSVWSMGDSAFYAMRPVHTRAEADEIARRNGGRVLAVRPNWSMPARDWRDADPDFWRHAPTRRRSP